MSKLSKYEWGFGVEHEMHIFHRPVKSSAIKEFILFDGKSAIQRLIKDNKLTNDELKLIEEVPFEPTGRLCNGEWVIKKVNVNMPEFITSYPFCSILKNRYISNMTQELRKKTRTYLNILSRDTITQKQIKKYGPLSSYPYSMTSYLKEPLNPNQVNYKLPEKTRLEYLGSYHITITLPYVPEKITKQKFIKNHQNFANQLQWLEPLLCANLFSCDQRCIGTKNERVKGSFRVMMIGWGNFAGSDIRKFNKGIGRYSNIKSYWREGLHFTDLERLKPCYRPSPVAVRENAISSLSSDFRTFGSTDPERPEHRESGAPMTVPNGIEFRIFDHFNDEHIEDLCKIITLMAENSRVHKSSAYVYDNKNWNNAMHLVMKHGWKAQLKKAYVNDLRKQLGLKINTTSLKAYDVYQKILSEIYNKHKSGDYTKIMTGIIPSNHKYKKQFMIDLRKPNDININRGSIDLSIYMKLMNNKTFLKNMNQFLKHTENSIHKMNNDFRLLFFKFFNKNMYHHNIEDILYFLEKNGEVNLQFHKNGEIEQIHFRNGIQLYTQKRVIQSIRGAFLTSN